MKVAVLESQPPGQAALALEYEGKKGGVLEVTKERSEVAKGRGPGTVGLLDDEKGGAPPATLS
jgi:hypothetical protein